MNNVCNCSRGWHGCFCEEHLDCMDSNLITCIHPCKDHVVFLQDELKTLRTKMQKVMIEHPVEPKIKLITVI